MPIYEYKCTQCGHRFDKLQRMGADGSDLTCPNCGAPRPEKMLSAFSSSGGGLDSYASSGRSCNTGFG
ncbi:zinc ribbon domain-containing protein [candidate division KSB1 bacterium]|nr:zinc ribbon domain-containing protein [candidate division KSB1 bacterium]RQW04388.1 MAG: zinc ribbon domain-containing protein [candidate division KSB1 bacterium]